MPKYICLFCICIIVICKDEASPRCWHAVERLPFKRGYMDTEKTSRALSSPSLSVNKTPKGYQKDATTPPEPVLITYRNRPLPNANDTAPIQSRPPPSTAGSDKPHLAAVTNNAVGS